MARSALQRRCPGIVLRQEIRIMSNESSRSPENRRRFLRLSAAGLAAIPIVRVGRLHAAEMVDENSPTAKALDYHADASKVTNPKRKKDQFCHNCQFFQGTAKDKPGPCTVFQGKDVAANGWCSTWVAKA
jgi:hypothetical protein